MSQKSKRVYVNYNSYIKSNKWFDNHPQWLRTVGYRCTMFPWVRIGNGHRYAVHHMNYRNLGNERLGRDVIPLCPFAHNYVVHGILAGFKSAGKQRNYPNLAQRLVHFWCVQRRWFKGIILSIILLRVIHYFFF